ncbi:MarR family winged helix-turn-helix transcriptional regulator [Altericroceibacterium endophyticum]|uniref:MarR family transcriptional regulator n=1 Tax=Altericroceibacterium endophyticum TaxID=1808508 RepID=A0A6I4TA06_9SPHN|nr:MarR family transcriptional regulator [Altericroceibacterium endophyticum]MXO66595.1 MarR family transcriptional regulator [Altericroceibacterium endophyticum]
MSALYGSDHFPYQLLILAKKIDRQATRHLHGEFGLTLAEWRVLAFIGVAGPSSASLIGRDGHVDRAEISRAVSRLTEAGLVTRQPAENNKRRLIIHTTPEGQDLFIKIRDHRRTYYQTLTHSISEEDKNRLSQAIRDMSEEVDRLQDTLGD